MKRVLLVDDDSLARNYFKTLLLGEGYEVVEAGDGKEAVKMYRASRPDLIVTDIFMPKMSGLDALLELDPRADGVPVIALSGGGSGTGSDPLKLAESLGAVKTFHKPFPYKEFLAAVKGALGA
jgi:two-component system, chemotaxis family, chemotaxis protein CheY